MPAGSDVEELSEIEVPRGEQNRRLVVKTARSVVADLVTCKVYAKARSRSGIAFRERRPPFFDRLTAAQHFHLNRRRLWGDDSYAWLHRLNEGVLTVAS